jgi:hypothetical protein
MWEYMVHMTFTLAGLCRKGSGTSPWVMQPESEAVHLSASGAEVKMRRTSRRLRGVVLNCLLWSGDYAFHMFW